MVNESISNQIRHLRKSKGISQATLAERCQVSRATIVNVENENADPSLTLLQLIAIALDCRVQIVPKVKDENC